jgi:hypothetical protein
MNGVTAIEEFEVELEKLRDKLLELGVKKIVVAVKDEVKYKFPADLEADETVNRVRALIGILGAPGPALFVKPSSEIFYVYVGEDSLVVLVGDLDEGLGEEYSLIAKLLINEVLSRG